MAVGLRSRVADLADSRTLFLKTFLFAGSIPIFAAHSWFVSASLSVFPSMAFCNKPRKTYYQWFQAGRIFSVCVESQLCGTDPGSRHHLQKVASSSPLGTVRPLNTSPMALGYCRAEWSSGISTRHLSTCPAKQTERAFASPSLCQPRLLMTTPMTPTSFSQADLVLLPLTSMSPDIWQTWLYRVEPTSGNYYAAVR
ncbi:hypothetical protein BCR34DRAFT_369044 [Clohesyomyces aquaticus]|uniref:Uncharacterized protein n=1 Tax=Clohesyomyces aquaticus TaxID=1231657 RepID=A0A1Y1ZGV5_9PLEO|nr:hypothetical protein BCR34DRAFT_369044 [Clohesyomyces aquaticus]